MSVDRTGRRRMGSRRRRLFGLVAVLLSVAFCGVASEIGLRLFWDGYYVRGPRGHLVLHDTRGWTTAPSVRVEFGDPEFSITLAHNALGFRGPEIDVAKPLGRVRVLALGDSMTYGLGVEGDETYASILEDLDPRLEVINAGVPAYSTAEELQLLVENGLRLEPDIVLVAYLWNDLIGAYRGTYSEFRPEAGGVRVVPPEEPARDHWVLQHKRTHRPILGKSHLYRFASDRIKILRYVLRERLGHLASHAEAVPPAEIDEAWALSYALLRQIARVARSAGAEPVLVIVPDQIQVDPTLRVVGVPPELHTVQARLLPFARDAGIPTIDLLPDLRTALEREGEALYHRYDRHWNARGHRRAAERIYAGLIRLGLLTPLEAAPPHERALP